jgi:phosphohistidine phosphatase
MLLYIVRHAWAGHSGDPQYPDDRLRPLTAEGRKRFRRMVRKLVKRSFDPAHIATSPLVRCRQTADVIADSIQCDAEVTELGDLAPGGELRPLLEWTQQQLPADVAWVGHSPDAERLIAELIGDRDGGVRLSKGAVACIQFDEELAPGHGELIWLATAALLGV